MTRALPEWIGDTDDTRVPGRVRLRVFEARDGRCGLCGRKVRAGEHWTCEHVIALINGGKNSEENLGVTCSLCLADKNADDVGEKSKTYRMRAKHLGIELKRKQRWGWR